VVKASASCLLTVCGDGPTRADASRRRLLHAVLGHPQRPHRYRKDAEVTRSKDSGFYNDALDVRATTRVGIGFLHEAAVVRGYKAA
jgi:hypothetical protein